MKYLWTLVLFFVAVTAERYIESTSLLTCMANSEFTASTFDVKFYPDDNKVEYDISAISNINANVTATITLVAYGVNALERNISFCSLGYAPVCPLTPGHLDLQSDYTIDSSYVEDIPGVAYTIPDLDARVRVVMLDESGNQIACVEAILSNGKTVQTKYAAWPIAAISGLGLITSGIVSVIGHSNTAAHIASNSMSLFVYFQSLAITAMMAVAKVPPIAAAWAQNFMWSVGIIRVGFVQDIANWYVQSTGGLPTDIVGTEYLSISVQKRAWDYTKEYAQYATNQLVKRVSIDTNSDDFMYSDSVDSALYTTDERSQDSSKILILRGMQRVAYMASIEITDLFVTSISFLLFFTFVLLVALMFFKAIVEILVRSNIIREGRFGEYREQWAGIIKGSLYRLMLVALPQVSVMCIWELTVRDSAATVVVAVFLLVIVVVWLIQAAVRVVLLGARSVRQFKNPAYLLYGKPKFLNRFGFLYNHLRADKYYFICVSIAYIFFKSLFVAVLQNYGRVQLVIVFAIELIYTVLLCWLRPFMDKRTNAFNIVIAVINTLNALFFMFFSDIFGAPHVVSSVMAVVYFVLNAVFAAFLLIFTIITCALALLYKNPDTRYQPMKDDRVSFLTRMDQNKPNERGQETELMALGATAMMGQDNGKASEMYGDSASLLDKNSSRKNRDSFAFDLYDPIVPSSTISNNHDSNRKKGSHYDMGNRVNFI